LFYFDVFGIHILWQNHRHVTVWIEEYLLDFITFAEYEIPIGKDIGFEDWTYPSCKRDVLILKEYDFFVDVTIKEYAQVLFLFVRQIRNKLSPIILTLLIFTLD